MDPTNTEPIVGTMNLEPTVAEISALLSALISAIYVLLGGLVARTGAWIGKAREHAMFAWILFKNKAIMQTSAGNNHYLPKLQKVFVFGEDSDLIEYRDITRDFDPATWEDAADDAGWKSARLEIRFSQHKRKHRLVVRRGEQLTWPLRTRRQMGQPRCFLSAVLASSSGPARRDVTARLNKYFSVAQNTGVKTHDMFPFDDVDYESEVYDELRLVYPDLTRKTLSFSKNDVVF